MISPERAPVRPRVKRPGGQAATLLEDEIAEIASQGCGGMVLVRGAPGSGRTTAMKHLAAVLSPAAAIMLLDPGETTCPREFAAAILADHALVVTTEVIAERKADVELELVPWGRDEWIEYLLACHPGECKSVMTRLLAQDEQRKAMYSAEYASSILDEMADDESVSSPLDAMICRLSKRFSREQQLALSPLALKSIRSTQCMPWDAAAAVVPDIDRSAWRLLNHPQVASWIAAAYAAKLLKEGSAADDERCLGRIEQLPRGYLYDLAALVRGDVELNARLLRIVQAELPLVCAAATSVLHLAGVLPPPISGSRPACALSLAGAILEGAQWPGVSLSRMDLRGADFSGAKLFQAHLEAAQAQNADFSQADLRQASLQNATFVGGNLAGANLSRAKAQGAQFTGADCRGVNFANAYLADASFQNADLTEACFRGAQLAEATLHGAAIDDADFTGADLRRVALTGRNLGTAHFRDAVFTQANLTGCQLEGLELPSAMFLEANLTNATFTAARMPGANLRDANLRGCGLADVDWEGADLRRADLRGAVFSMGGSRSGLVGSPYPGHGSRTGFYTDDFNDLSTHKHPEEIRKANLCGADLRGANIEGVDFYLVDLRGARYDAEQADQLRRCGAILREPVA